MLAQEERRTRDDGGFVVLLGGRGFGRGVAEETNVAAPRDGKRPLFDVSGEGDSCVACALRAAVDRERGRGFERIVGRDAARVAEEEVRVRVAVAGEVRELTADQEAAVRGQVSVLLGERVAEDTRSDVVRFAVERDLEPGVVVREKVRLWAVLEKLREL